MTGAGGDGGVLMDRAAVEALLPHRAPFLLVDEVLELEPGVRCRARRTLREDDFWFAGHFPGNPVMPGVLIVEALAQTGAIATLAQPGNEGKLMLFAGIDKVRFKRLVRPGDTLDLRCEVIAMRAGVGRGKVVATVEGDMACRGELMFAVVDAGEAAQGQPSMSPGAAAVGGQAATDAPLAGAHGVAEYAGGRADMTGARRDAGDDADGGAT